MKKLIFYFWILKSFSFSFNQNIPYACRDGYYYDRYQKKCVECRKECYKCSQNSFNCKKCSSGQYIVDHVCKKCIQNCDNCENNYACKRCKKGYFVNSSNKCQQCTLPNCQECASEYKCKTCSGNGIILDNLSGKCVKCDNNCSTCRNLTACYYCLNGFGLDTINHKCTYCGYRCNKCKGNKCIGCTYSNYPLKPFDTGCYRCDIENCISCNSDFICDKCEDNYILKGSRCVYKYKTSEFLTGVIVGPIVIFIIIFIIIYFICIKKKRNQSTINPLNKDSNETIEDNDGIPESINEENEGKYFEEENKNYDGFDTNIGSYE